MSSSAVSSLEQLAAPAQGGETLAHLARIRGADLGHLEQHRGLLGVDAGLGEFLGDALGADLVDLVQPAQGRLDVGNTQRLAHALDDLAVVHEHAHRWERQVVESLGHDEGQIHLEVEGQLAVTDNVDIGLRELAETALLGTLAAPHLLDLVALEREIQLVRVLHDVAGEGHRQVEVQAHTFVLGRTRPGSGGLEGLEAIQNVDLLRGLALGLELSQRLDRARLDARESVQLKDTAQLVEDMHLDDAALGEPFGET